MSISHSKQFKLDNGDHAIVHVSFFDCWMDECPWKFDVEVKKKGCRKWSYIVAKGSHYGWRSEARKVHAEILKVIPESWLLEVANELHEKMKPRVDVDRVVSIQPLSTKKKFQVEFFVKEGNKTGVSTVPAEDQHSAAEIVRRMYKVTRQNCEVTSVTEVG